MPVEGMEWVERSKLLSFEEIFRIAKVLVEEAGVTSIRLTGGEPTVRARLPILVERLAGLGVDMSMTTNGATLAHLARDLHNAGLKRLNISIDSLDRQRFTDLTRRDQLDAVLEGIEIAVDVGFKPVKLNVVLMNGINEDEIVDFLHYGRDKGVTIRFIEFMPLDAQSEWSSERVVTAEKILAEAAQVFSFTPQARGNAPAERFAYDDGWGEFGVIPSVTRPFCGDCDRMRLTADGQFRNCLFGLEHTDLRDLLRSGANDEELVSAMAGEISRKWAGHAIGQVHFIRPSKSMSQLGG